MKRTLLALAAALLAIPAGLDAQGPWRLALTAGPYRVDRLAGTPIVPTATLTKQFGGRMLAGGSLGLVRAAGFYGLDALTLDLHVGVRSAPAKLEGFATGGPTTLLGGDGDGTPYLSTGLHLTTGVNWWVGPRIGFTASATGRVWVTTGNSRFSPSATAGIVFRL